MKTSLGHDGKLSQGQITRLGGLIAVICNRVPYEPIMRDLTDLGFIEFEGGEVIGLSDGGRFELNRLTAMAGLRPEQFSPSL